MPSQHKPLSRRQFLQHSAAAGALGLIGAAWPVRTRPQPLAGDTNPFAYDVSRLTKTDPKLVHYEQVGRTAASHEDARRITVGPDDQLLIASGTYVTMLDRQKTPLIEIALTAPARCLTVTPGGEILVGLRDHVEVFDTKGQRRAAWDSPGPKAWLTGITANAKDVYLADAGNRIVWRCDRMGKILGRIGEKNKDRNIPGFIVPSPFFDLELHPDGLLRVANPGRHRVEAYTVDGDLEMAWGVASTGVEGFCGCCNPINIALLPDGRLVTCEKGLPRVKVYRTDGTFESVVAGPESFPENAKVSAGESLSDGSQAGLDAAVDSAGRIYILDLVTADIRIMACKATGADSSAPPPRSQS